MIVKSVGSVQNTREPIAVDTGDGAK